MIRILCVTDYYLPGFKGGGPIRTIANLRELLTGNIEFAIVTRDRDLGSDSAYPGVRANSWQHGEAGPVYYASPDMFGMKGLLRAATEYDFDILYLNSFFGYRSSIAAYFHYRKSTQKILIAPRGEFSAGALALKKFKKRLFLTFCRLFGLYRNVQWHASTVFEAEDILRLFPYAKGRIHLAADPVSIGSSVEESRLPKAQGKLRIAFISRISPMKNLDGLLDILSGVDRAVELTIYGPLEDADYWSLCERAIGRLPSNIRAEYHGLLAPDDVTRTFAGHDLFAFPTHGENFGHVIFEALRAGTPVMVSDQTPWQADASGAITVAPLGSYAIWRKKIEEAADRSPDEQRLLRKTTLDYARRYAASEAVLSDNLKMFQSVAKAGL